MAGFRSRPVLRAVASLAAASAALAVVTTDRLAARQSAAPQVTFRSAADFVEVDVFVTDKTGAFVRNLSAQDFEVLEDGRPVRVEAFSLVDIPFVTAEAPTTEDYVEPGYLSNEGGIEGRIYMIVLDTNHVSALRTPKAKDLVRQFVLNNVAANDKVAVVHVGRTDLSQDFTSNKRLVLKSVDAFAGEKLRSPALSKWEALVRQAGGTRQEGVLPVPRDPEAQRRAAIAAQTFQSLSSLGDYMAGIQGRRKAILLVSEGLDLDLADTVGPRPGTEVNVADSSVRIDTELFNNTSMEAALASQVVGHIQSMVETATRANVAIYAIDPRGITDAADMSIEFAGTIGEGGSAMALPTGAFRREVRDSQQSLRSVAEQTGGTAIVGTNNFGDGFQRVVADNSTYYVLGYRTAPKYDGKFHTITVRAKRPGLEVRARRGYYALKAKPVVAPDVLRNLLTSPMAMPGLTMRVASTVLRGPDDKGLVQFTLEFDQDLPFEDKGAAFANKVELSYLALDLEGRTQATASKTLDMAITPDVRAKMAESGLRFATELALAPGRYQIRLAAREAVGGSAGSVFWDVEVPTFGGESLAMTDLVLSSAVAGGSPTVHDATTLKSLLPVPPTTGREFTLEDELTVFTEVYDRRADPHAVTLSLVVKTDDGVEVFSAVETRESTERQAARQSYPYAVKVPLRDLVPGRFTVSATATSSTGQKVGRDVRIRIR